MVAASLGHYKLVKLLVEDGLADINVSEMVCSKNSTLVSSFFSNNLSKLRICLCFKYNSTQRFCQVGHI